MEALLTIAQNWYIATFIIGVGMLIYGGNLLVEGSVAIAKQLGVSTLVIGLTVVAFSTSSPELALNVVASINGHGDLCLGNIFGSNIANIGLVLGIGALICKLPVTGRVVRWEFPLLVVGTLLVGLVTMFGSLNRIWAVAFLCLFIIVMWIWFWLGIKESKVAKQSGTIISENERPAILSYIAVVVGLFFLAVGGKATEIGAVTSAINFGLSEIVVGSTVVAIATSLPEVVTTVIAARKGHPDLAVGNVVGSNLFNILFVLPITMLVNPIPIPQGIWIYVSIMFFMTALAWVLTTDKRVRPKEGVLLVSLYAAFLIGITIWALKVAS